MIDLSIVTPARAGRALRLAAVSVLALGCAACAGYQGGAASAATAPAAYDFVGWDAYLGGSDSSQYSALDQVNTGNVDQLEVVWEFPTGDGAAPLFNPVVAGGRMYVIDGESQLVALQPTTGQVIWRTSLDGRIGVRGTNYWASADGSDERLFVLAGGMLRAIDAKTGQVIPSFGNDGGIDLRDALANDVTMPASPTIDRQPRSRVRGPDHHVAPCGCI